MGKETTKGDKMKKLVMIAAASLIATACTPWEVKVAEGVIQVIEDEMAPTAEGPGYPEDFICTPPPGMNGPVQPIS